MTTQALEDVARTAKTTGDVPLDIPRDRWKRPLILQPDGSAIAYTRASTFAGYLDDTTNLTKWKQRQMALGLSRRPDLQLRVVSLGPPPSKLEEAAYKQWKTLMDEVCDAAQDAAESGAAAIVGSALHSFTDRIDQGLELGIVPEAYKPHLKAYEQATACLTAIHMERFVVCDELQVAGTADRFVKVDGHNKLVCADTKSGNTDFAAKIAIQMAVYAHGRTYDPGTGARGLLGNGDMEVDLDRGLIIALSALRGTCELIWIDLVKGWRGAKVAAEVRDWRKERQFTEPYSAVAARLPMAATVAQENARDLTAEARAALEVAIPRAASEAELDRLWRAAGNQWTAAHTAAARARMAELANLQPHLTPVG